MKLLYIGPYRQNDGWGEAAKDLVRALNLSKFDVAIKPVFMCNNLGPITPELEKLENNRFDDYDVCIQQVLPTVFDRNSAFPKNVGAFFSETNHLEYTPWPTCCNLMDSIQVSSNVEKKNLITSGITKPIDIVHVPVDTSKFERSYPKVDLGISGESFNFYYIGEYVERKNLPALLLAFHLEFSPQEPVNLVIKTSKGGAHPDQVKNMIQQEIGSLKQSFGIYRNVSDYKQEIIITQFINEEEMNMLHASCDCFVMPSHGEAWCRPAIDAMGFGNTPIVTANTGMEEFINDSTGWLVPSIEAPVLCLQRPNLQPYDYLYRARETWQNISIVALRKAMREAYENKSLKSHKNEQGIEQVYNFSYSKVAEQINDSYS